MKTNYKTISKALLLTTFAAIALTLSACSGASDMNSSNTDTAKLKKNVSQQLSKAKSKDSTLSKFLDNASGYAVYPSITQDTVGANGAFSQGIVYKDGKAIGFTSLTQERGGTLLDGKSFTEIIVFSTPQALKKFKKEKLTFNSKTSVNKIKSGAAASAKYNNGIAVFIMGGKGFIASTSISYQRISFKPIG